jgi:hypothetical protein
LATATAVRDARAGLRVLTVSTDQAHSIGDVLGTAVTPTGLREPTRVLADDADAGGGFLDALALDTLALLAARWREVADLSGRLNRIWGDIAPEELSAAGIRRCSACRSWRRSAQWDHVVVDCVDCGRAADAHAPRTFGLYLGAPGRGIGAAPPARRRGHRLCRTHQRRDRAAGFAARWRERVTAPGDDSRAIGRHRAVAPWARWR